MSERLDAIRDRAWKAQPPNLGHEGSRAEYAADRNLDLELAEVTRVPQLTLAGTVWMRTIAPPKKGKGEASYDLCSLCAQEGNCRDAVQRGDFVACEKLLRKEVL